MTITITLDDALMYPDTKSSPDGSNELNAAVAHNAIDALAITATASSLYTMTTSTSSSFVSPVQARSINGAPVQISRFCMVHMASTFAVVGVGSAVMMMRKGTRQHRILGRIWSGAMVTACLSSYGIRNRNQGGFSWLHGLSTLTLGSVGAGIYYIKQKKVAKHMKFMRMSFFGALGTGFLAVSQVDRVGFKKLFS